MNILNPEITDNPWRLVGEKWRALEVLNGKDPIEMKKGFDQPDSSAVLFHKAEGEVYCWRYREEPQ